MVKDKIPEIKMLSVKQVGETLNIGKTTATNIVKSLPHMTIKRKLLVSEAAFIAWVKSRIQYPSEQTSQKKEPRKRKPALNDLCLLDEEGKIPTRKKLEQMMKRKGATA